MGWGVDDEDDRAVCERKREEEESREEEEKEEESKGRQTDTDSWYGQQHHKCSDTESTLPQADDITHCQ